MLNINKMSTTNRSKKILICDEDFMIANLVDQKFRKNLETSNTIVEDGNRAFEAIDIESFDLIITALYLPYKSGYDIIQYVKEVKKAETPIILLTTVLTDDVIMNASLMGAEDFIKKPYNPLELLIRARKLLN